MKILHFSSGCYPDNLGTARRLSQLLLDDGHEHYFIAPATLARSEDPGWKRYENFHLRRCPQIRRLKLEPPVLGRYLKSVINSRRLLGFLPPGDPEIVHGHTPLACALAARRFAADRNLPLLYEIHTLYVDEVAPRRVAGVPSGFNRAAKTLAKVWEAGIIRRSRRVIVQTESLGRRVVELFRIRPELVRVVPNGIDGMAFDPAARREDRARLRRERGWEGKRVVLYSGYLDRINGVDFLLRAAGALPAGVKGRARLVLAGDGPLAGLVRRRAGEGPAGPEFLGKVDPSRMPGLYAAADIFVIPRPDTEAGRSLVPIKLLEAMAMEKVVLASDLDALREVIGADRCGVLFRREDDGEFREKLGAVIERYDEFAPLGTRARTEVLARYDWGRSRRLLGELYRELAEAGGKP